MSTPLNFEQYLFQESGIRITKHEKISSVIIDVMMAGELVSEHWNN